jgi:hypothetical protein
MEMTMSPCCFRTTPVREMTKIEEMALMREKALVREKAPAPMREKPMAPVEPSILQSLARYMCIN